MLLSFLSVDMECCIQARLLKLRVSFDSLKKLEGTVESLRIYISGRFFAHNLTALNTYASISVRAIKGGAYGVQPGNTFSTIQTNIQDERIFSYASGPIYEIIKPERYDTLGMIFKHPCLMVSTKHYKQ